MSKVLVIDDNSDIVYVIRQVLSKDQHEVIDAVNAADGLQLAKTEIPDIIILDIHLPDIDGFEACRQLKSEPSTRDIPIIFLTAKYKESTDLARGLELGAEDYLTKPFDNIELRARVRLILRLSNQLQQLHQKNQELALKNQELTETRNRLEELAVTDTLTSLYNRRYFVERIEEEFNYSLRHAHPISLVLVDIDNFKAINDNYGHQCGDEILKQMAHILESHVRKREVLARYGGEEFAIGLFGPSAQGAYRLAERIREQVVKHPFIYESHTLNLSVSAGVGSFSGEEGEEPQFESLFKKVDAALYKAKQHGRNQTVSADEDL